MAHVGAEWEQFCREESKILVSSIACKDYQESPEEMRVQARQHIYPKIVQVEEDQLRDSIVERFLESVETERRNVVRQKRIARMYIMQKNGLQKRQ